MGHRDTLTEKQVVVLRWIDDGCPVGVVGESARISAAALARRDLVRTSGRGPMWEAKTTEAGKEYLRKVDGPNPPTPRQANVSVTEQLVADVEAAGGTLRVPGRRWGDPDSIDYLNRAALAERHGKVPTGKRLIAAAVAPGEIEIKLVDLPDEVSGELADVPVPEKVGRYHPLVKRFREASDFHEVSRAALPRACRILHGLFSEAERRGYRVELPTFTKSVRYGDTAWSGSNDGHFSIIVDENPTAIRLTEEGLQSRTYWEKKNRRWELWGRGEGGYKLPPLTEYEANATGRLELEIVSGWSSRGTMFADRESWTLEEKLPELLRELKLRAVEAREREQQRTEVKARREREREAALERARERYVEARRGDVLKAEVGRWREAQDIRAYCDAVEAVYPDDADARQWVEWGRRRADELDPLRDPPELPAPPENVPLHELRPFLEPGIDPYGSHW